MEKFKKFLQKFFFINGMAAAVLCVVSAVLLTIVFTKKLENSPVAILAYVLSASKFLNLSAALMSLFALQTAMLTQFGDGTVNSTALNACTGFFVTFSTVYVAISMIIRAKKEINKTKT